MRNLLAPAVVFAVFGLGQSISGWQSPLIGVTMMAVAGSLALAVLASWLRPRWAWVDHCYTFFGVALADELRAPVPEGHSAELRAVARNAARELDHVSPDRFWPTKGDRLRKVADAHFPELSGLVIGYRDNARKLNATSMALTARIATECESRGVTGSDPSLEAHTALHSRLLVIASHRVPPEPYAREWEAAPALPGLAFMDAVNWPEVAAIRAAYDAERAARLAALERATEDAARETLYATPDCPTCALNLGERQ